MTSDQARCHLCGSADVEPWAVAVDVEYGATGAEQFGYVLCPLCDALSIAPLPADRLEEIYPSTYYSFASGGDVLAEDRNPITRIKAALDARTARGALAHVGSETPHVLDVGGGTGTVAASVLRAAGPGARATVVDIDAESVELARARGFGGFAGRFEDFDTSERFHLVAMLNLIEHVPDPAAMLVKARELLAPGGLVWLQTPNFRALDARLFRDRSWTGLHCPRHFVIFSAAGLRQALAGAGLEPVRFTYTQAGSFWAGSLLGGGRARRPLARLADSPRPLVRHPLFLPLAAAGAAFDFATARVRPTSQVVVLARAA